MYEAEIEMLKEIIENKEVKIIGIQKWNRYL